MTCFQWKRRKGCMNSCFSLSKSLDPMTDPHEASYLFASRKSTGLLT